MNEKETEQKSVFHEMRNALSVLSGLIDLMASTRLDEEQSELIEKIYRALDQTGKVLSCEEQPVPVDIRQFMHDFVDVCGPIISAKRLGVMCGTGAECDGLFPLCEGRLTQVLLNLVRNAVKFTDSGKILLSVNYFPKEEELEFIVEDTGCGIAKGDLSLIFKPHTRLDFSVEGDGLGLSISKDLVRQMGGTIWAESELGKGSQFYVVLPAKRQLNTAG